MNQSSMFFLMLMHSTPVPYFHNFMKLIVDNIKGCAHLIPWSTIANLLC